MCHNNKNNSGSRTRLIYTNDIKHKVIILENMKGKVLELNGKNGTKLIYGNHSVCVGFVCLRIR